MGPPPSGASGAGTGSPPPGSGGAGRVALRGCCGAAGAAPARCWRRFVNPLPRCAGELTPRQVRPFLSCPPRSFSVWGRACGCLPRGCRVGQEEGQPRQWLLLGEGGGGSVLRPERAGRWRPRRPPCPRRGCGLGGLFPAALGAPSTGERWCRLPQRARGAAGGLFRGSRLRGLAGDTFARETGKLTS